MISTLARPALGAKLHHQSLLGRAYHIQMRAYHQCRVWSSWASHSAEAATSFRAKAQAREGRRHGDNANIPRPAGTHSWLNFESLYYCHRALNSNETSQIASD